MDGDEGAEETDSAETSEEGNILSPVKMSLSLESHLKFCALILSRGSSKSIAGKNVKLLNGIPLISHVLGALEDCTFLDEVWVSTDEDQIIKTVHDLHPFVKFHKRSASTSSETSSSLEAVQEFANHRQDADVICLIQCTSPCFYPKYLREACDKIKDGFPSAFSVTRDHKLRWKRLSEDRLQAANFDPYNRPRRQDWDGEMIESGHFYVATRELILEEGLLQSQRKCAAIEVPQELCLEIDHPFQWPLAEVMVRNHGYTRFTQ